LLTSHHARPTHFSPPHPPKTENAEVYAWGSGEYGKIGCGDEEKHRAPTLVETLQGKGVVAVAAGGFHSVALTDDGVLYTWGGGEKGQLGHGDEKNQMLPKPVGAIADKKVTQVGCGMHHTVVITGSTPPQPLMMAFKTWGRCTRLAAESTAALDSTTSSPTSCRRSSRRLRRRERFLVGGGGGCLHI
jgi:alpha-tubulin suppressor-like RCC1 family protein